MESNPARAPNAANRDNSVSLPKAPNPTQDPGVIPTISSPSFDQVGDVPEDGQFDINVMQPLLALKILAHGIQSLLEITGDVPPTPPLSRPTTPTKRDLVSSAGDRPKSPKPTRPASMVPSSDLSKLKFDDTVIGSPEAHISEPTTTEDSSRMQLEAVARKFFSKKPPAIPLDEYLLRLHRYCPMSTAVYLAAAVYIYRLSVETKIVPVTTRTVHRLTLTSLRVAMKALEDLSYPHQRFAGVGGVSQKELAKLEISLCYLIGFELMVTSPLLYEKAKALQQLAKMPKAFKLSLGLPLRENRNRRSTVS